jgi:hypothetical protein
MQEPDVEVQLSGQFLDSHLSMYHSASSALDPRLADGQIAEA